MNVMAEEATPMAVPGSIGLKAPQVRGQADRKARAMGVLNTKQGVIARGQRKDKVAWP